MKTVKLGEHKVEVYDSIDDLPIKRFHKFNKYLLIDAGVGSDINDINDHIAKIDKYINNSDKKNAKIELENLRQSLYMIANETNVKHISFMALVKSIDGKEITDISDDNLQRLQKIIGDTKLATLNNEIEAVKKKIDQELNIYFPGQFDDAAVKEYFTKWRARLLLQLDGLISGLNHNEEINQIDDFLFSLSKPNIFYGKDSAEVAYNKRFEEMSLFLTHELGVDVNKMSVLQFYNAFDYVKKLRKSQQL